MKSMIKTPSRRAAYITCVSLVAASALLFSCKKKEEKIDDPKSSDTEQATITDNNLAENISADIEAMGGEATDNGSLTLYRSSGVMCSSGILSAVPCATVSTVPASRIYTVDFGTSGCTGLDGRTRTGKLVYDCSSSASNALYYRNPGFRMTVSSQNFVVDGNQVNITSKQIANTTPSTIPTGTNPGTNLTWSITASIAITKAGGGSLTWSCSRTKELVNTADSNCYRGQSRAIAWHNAIVKLNGSATGTNANNETFNAVSTNLVRDFNCSPFASHPHRHPFISGTMAYTPGNRPTRYIDYGNGACDVNATLTVNNSTVNIVLP